jgi:hypothetical protein
MAVRVNKDAFNIREKLSELAVKFGLKGSELARAETVQEARDLVSAGRRNLIINGAMNVWQRGTAQTTVATGVGFLADRWQVATAGSAQLTQEQSTDSPPGFTYSLKVSPSVTDTLVSTEQMHVMQHIEAQNLTFLNWGSNDGIPITITFWAKSSDTSNKCLWLYAQDAGDHIARQFNCKQANTWEKFTFTIPPNPGGVINNDNGSGLYVRIILDAGASAANGSLPETWTNLTSAGRYGTLEPGFAESTSNEFYLTGVQVEAGKNATDFEYRSYGEELALCQRYFERVGGTRYAQIGVGKHRATSQSYFSTTFKVQKRAAPTASFQGDIITSDRYVYDQFVASLNDLESSIDGIHARFDHTAVGAEHRPIFILSAPSAPFGYMDFSAEL